MTLFDVKKANLVSKTKQNMALGISQAGQKQILFAMYRSQILILLGKINDLNTILQGKHALKAVSANMKQGRG